MTDKTIDTTPQGVSDEALDSIDDIAAALLAQGEDAEQPSDTEGDEPKKKRPAADETPDTKAVEDDQAEDEEEVAEEEGETEEDEAEGPKRKFVEEDDAYVKVKVGDEEHEIPVKDLKRLAGQEAAFTKKSQELSQHRKIVEDVATLQVQTFDKLLQQARVNWEPFAKVDFLQLARNPDVTEEQINALRQEAERRWNELQFLEHGLQEVNTNAQKAIQDRKMAAAKACIEALSDPTTGIEGWGEPLYKELSTYAQSQGVPADILNDLTDPGTYKLLHKAMLYDRGKAKVTEVKNAKKPSAPPKKIIKASRSVGAVKDQIKGAKSAHAEAKFKQSGSVDDAAALMLERWGTDE